LVDDFFIVIDFLNDVCLLLRGDVPFEQMFHHLHHVLDSCKVLLQVRFVHVVELKVLAFRDEVKRDLVNLGLD